jgi:hypothetical protein
LHSAGNFLFDIARTLFAVSFAGESFFGPALLSGFEVKRVALDFFDDIFLLNFSLETAQGALKRFTILQMDFCQLISPPSTNSGQLEVSQANTPIVT